MGTYWELLGREKFPKCDLSLPSLAASGENGVLRRRLPSPATRGHSAGRPLICINRRGDTYYLHTGTTKKRKPRYFVAKTVGAGALEALPEGFELTESINGVGSVR